MNADRLPSRILLDSCAVIWLANAEPLPAPVVETFRRASHAGRIFVSTASAWEIGLLSRPKPNRRLDFLPDPKTWFSRFLSGPGIQETPITATIAIDASYLPGDFHSDPMGRLIVATARHLGLPVVASDRRIIAFAQAGHVDVIPC